MNKTSQYVPNWFIHSPDPNVSIGHLCDPYKIEMVVRSYLAGHAFREYKNGKRLICGVELPNGLKENDKLPEPIITPSTKAEIGNHDEDISREEIIDRGIVSIDDYTILEKYTKKLFSIGQKIANERGLILVDTKYEFGKTKSGKIVLIDEIHTPDSSRYFYKDGYEERQEKCMPQKQLSKEFLRQWLITNDFQGLEGQIIPEMNDKYIDSVSERYIELYEKIIGKNFKKLEINDIQNRIFVNTQEYLKSF
jgi:phosphoribosylaminoimidazole-succinocarboxamide synthase